MIELIETDLEQLVGLLLSLFDGVHLSDKVVDLGLQEAEELGVVGAHLVLVGLHPAHLALHSIHFGLNSVQLCFQPL